VSESSAGLVVLEKRILSRVLTRIEPQPIFYSACGLVTTLTAHVGHVSSLAHVIGMPVPSWRIGAMHTFLQVCSILFKRANRPQETCPTPPRRKMRLQDN